MPDMTKQLVLIVEDDPLVGIAVETMIVDAGFDVLLVTNGDDAVAAVEAGSSHFCALLTDVRMPGRLSGWDVARRARELFPFLPVIYMTGDSAGQWQAHGVPGSVLLEKPYAEVQLITALATLLNNAATNAH